MRTASTNSTHRCLVALATILSLGAAALCADAATEALRRGGVVRVAVVQVALGAAERGALPSADLLACAAGLLLLLSWAATVPALIPCVSQPASLLLHPATCGHSPRRAAIVRAASRGGRHGP